MIASKEAANGSQRIISNVEEAPEGGFAAQGLGHAIFSEVFDADEVNHILRSVK